jgi:hypothetical protein
VKFYPNEDEYRGHKEAVKNMVFIYIPRQLGNDPSTVAEEKLYCLDMIIAYSLLSFITVKLYY